MNKSESIANLAQALAQFQGEVTNPKNTANNPFFKSKYAPLSEVINTSKPILTKHGLSVLQSPSGDGERIIVTTLLMHSSGEWIEGEPLVLKADKATAQGAGSAISYGRRYALSAILGISSEEDDDGSHASGLKDKAEPQKGQSQKAVTQKSTEQKPVTQNAATEKQPVNFANFFITCKGMGYTSEQVHAFAKAESLKDWTREKLAELVKELKANAEQNGVQQNNGQVT